MAKNSVIFDTSPADKSLDFTDSWSSSAAKLVSFSNSSLSSSRTPRISVEFVDVDSNICQPSRSANAEEAGPSEDYDTDLDIPDDYGSPTKPQITPEEASHTVYVNICKELGILPHSSITSGLRKPFLRLRYRSLGGPAAKALSTALLRNKVVKVLDLEETDIGIDGVRYLADTIMENFLIRHLNISNNRLGDDGVLAITHVLCHNATVTHLNISGNKLTDNFGNHLAVLLRENDSLTRLHVSYNGLRDLSATALGQAIVVNATLKHLDLSWNCISGKGAASLCRGLKKNNSIKLVELAWNGIGCEGGVAVSELLRKNHKLEYLDISNTRINWQTTTQLARAVAKNTTIKILKMGGNPLTTTGSMELLEAASTEGCSLQLLDLSDVPVVAEFHLMGVAIEHVRPFQFIHGAIVNSHDLLGRQTYGTPYRSPQIKHPMQVVIEYIRKMQIRPLELFRSMDKSVLLKMTDKAFMDRLKSFGLPLHEHQLQALVRNIARKGSNKSVINYPKLVKSVTAHIAKERARKAKETELNEAETEERNAILHPPVPSELPDVHRRPQFHKPNSSLCDTIANRTDTTRHINQGRRVVFNVDSVSKKSV